VFRKFVLVLVLLAVAMMLGASVLLHWLVSGDGTRVTLEHQATAWLGEPVRIGRARAALVPRPGVQLRDVRVGDPARLTLSQVLLSTDLRGLLLDGRVEDAVLIITDSRIELPLPVATNRDTRQREPASVPGDGLRSMSVREVALRDVRLVSRGHEFVVTAQASLHEGLLLLHRLTAAAGDTVLEVDGEIDLVPHVEARLTAHATRLDLDELLVLAQAFIPETRFADQGASSSAVRLVADVTADTAMAAGVALDRFTTQLIVDGPTVTLVPLSFGLFGGQYEGSLEASFDDALAVTLRAQVADIDVGQLTAFGGSPNAVTGTLRGEGAFTADGSDVASALSTARGTGAISIVDGEIRRLGLVRTVVLFFGRPVPDSHSASDRFDR